MNSNDLLAELKRRGAYVEHLDHDVVRLRVSVIAGMIRDAHARGLEEALECCAEMLPEHEVERLRDIFRARAEAVRNGES